MGGFGVVGARRLTSYTLNPYRGASLIRNHLPLGPSRLDQFDLAVLDEECLAERCKAGAHAVLPHLFFMSGVSFLCLVFRV